MSAAAAPSIGSTSRVQELGDAGFGLDDVARWFDIADRQALVDTFPQVFHPLSRGQRFGIVDGERLVSHAATVAVELQDRSRALLVGSVASAPHTRGQGLASAVMQTVIERARTAGLDSVILWSALDEFFGRFGFVPAGSQFALPITGEAAARPAQLAGTGCRAATLADLPDLVALHRRKPLGVHRELGDFALLLAARPMTTTVMERNGQVVAYACYDKGADLSGWWHELGGDDADVLSLITTVMQITEMPTAMVLVAPYRTALRRALDATAAPQPTALRLALTPGGAGELFVDGLDSV